MSHLTEEDLILIYYAEPEAPAGARAHLAECRECREAAESLARALGPYNGWEAPERDPGFGRDVWNRLAPRLESGGIHPSPPGFWPRLFAGRAVRLALAASGCAILLAGVFFAGRLSRPAAPPAMAGLSDQARERILEIALADHLDRVQILLTEIADGDEASPETLAATRERAEDLVQESRLMRQSLAARGEAGTAAFLDEVGAFLTEAAHTPDGAPASARIRELRDRIDSASLLFKVRVVEANLRTTLSAGPAGNKEQKL